jgi:hypothetical protein
MFCINLWEFFIDPFSLVYNSIEQKTLFYVFLSFRNLTELKRSEDFLKSVFSQRNNMRRKSTGGGPQGPNEHMWRRPILGRATFLHTPKCESG